MAFDRQPYPKDSAARYSMILAQADALMAGVTHTIANLSNMAALMGQALPDVNWCGFYMMDHGELMLGPFYGLPACIRIPLGRGVCGTAAASDAVQRVYDVHAFAGHIACDSTSMSELVIPMHWDGRVIGVLDIDSQTIGRFSKTDEQYLSQLVRQIEAHCDFSKTGYTL